MPRPLAVREDEPIAVLGARVLRIGGRDDGGTGEVQPERDAETDLQRRPTLERPREAGTPPGNVVHRPVFDPTGG